MEPYRPSHLLKLDLDNATGDLTLSAKEKRVLAWLAEWDQDTVGPVITLLHKARRGTLEPPMPTWTERYR